MITEYEEIVDKYLDDIYRISLYYTKNEKLAEFITCKVFTTCLIENDDVDKEHILGIMVREIRQTILDILDKKYTGEELEQCIINGKK